MSDCRPTTSAALRVTRELSGHWQPVDRRIGFIVGEHRPELIDRKQTVQLVIDEIVNLNHEL
jgi:hypothetical protein